ncbi:MAG TPA: ATP-binding protein [Nitrospiria bacterium]|nr:ATP-binding protein [Nitrospiria bacterium]
MKNTIVRSPLYGIGLKLGAGFLLVILLTSAVALLSLFLLMQIAGVSQNLVSEHLPEAYLAGEIKFLILSMSNEQKGYLLSGGDEEYLKEFYERQREVESVFESLHELHDSLPDNTTQKERLLFTKIMGDYKGYKEISDRIAAYQKAGGHTEAVDIMLGEARTLRSKIVQECDDFIQYEADEINRGVFLAVQKSLFGKRLTLLGLTAALLVSMLLAVLLTSSVVSPLKKLVEVSEKATSGRLDVRANITRKDEIGFLADKFDQMIEKLQQTFNHQRQFLLDVAHELKTPLTIIRGNAEVTLRARNMSQDGYIETLRDIVNVTGEMKVLVEDLLLLSRFQVDELPFEMKSIDLAAVLPEIAQEIKPIAQDKNLTLDMHLPRQSLWILGDIQRIKQLFYILIENAFKFTPPGGNLSLFAEKKGTTCTIRFSDTGMGIPMDEQAHVFNRFYRGSRSAGGSGLGLSIAKSIMEKHQGSIEVNSNPGRGTEFMLSFPALMGGVKIESAAYRR